MGWYNIFLTEFVLPLVTATTGFKAWKYYNFYIKSDYFSEETIERLQWVKFKKLIEHAYNNVPLYKEKFDRAGIKPQDIRSFEDISKIPITTKKEIRETPFRKLIAKNYNIKKLRMSNTSGTTGHYLILFQDFRAINHMFAARMWGRHVIGAEVGDSVLRITPNECQACFVNPKDPSFEDFLKKLYVIFEKWIGHPILHRRKNLPPFPKVGNPFEPKILEFYTRQIAKSRKDLIMMYPLYAYFVARYILDTRKRITTHSKLMDCSGCLLTSNIKEIVKLTMGLDCFSTYGGCEFSRFGAECPDSGGLMHILEPFCYVEFVNSEGKPAKENETANIIITNLNSYAMPFIRYEHGDVGYYSNSKCSCGRHSRLMCVQGRIQGVIVNMRNEVIPARVFWEKLLGFKRILLFQLIQHNKKKYTLFLVPGKGYRKESERDIVSLLKDLLGEKAEIIIQYKSYIQCEHSGKFMLVKSSTLNEFRVASVRKFRTEIN